MDNSSKPIFTDTDTDDLTSIEPITNEPTNFFPASLLRRALAYAIDAVIAFIPIIVIMVLFNTSITFVPIACAPSPAVGVYLLKDIPSEVNSTLSTQDNDSGTSYTYTNVSTYATAVKLATYFAIGFYVFYTTLYTIINNGRTVGKQLLGIRIVSLREGNKDKNLFIREFLCKIVLNIIPICFVISLFTVLFTKNHLSIHDIIAKTMVIE